MVLHGHGVDEEGLVLVPLLILLNDAPGHLRVGHKAAGPLGVPLTLGVHEVLQRDDLIDAQVGVGGVAAPELGIIAMDGLGGVALVL